MLNLEQLQKIIKLAMYISTYCYRRLDRLNIAFFNQQVLDLQTKFAHSCTRRILYG